MKGFKLDSSGDIVITRGRLELVDGNELLRQTVESVIKTNKGEWEFNPEEGINHRAILTKMPDFSVVREEVLDGLSQVDETFVLEDFSHVLDGRTLKVSFVARNASDGIVEGSVDFE